MRTHKFYEYKFVIKLSLLQLMKVGKYEMLNILIRI